MWTLLQAGCLGILGYAHVGYPALMAVLARLRRKPLQQLAPLPAALSVVICAHNAETRIQARIRNLLDSRWGGELEIIIYCDGCTDATAAKADALNDARVRVIQGGSQRGKASALNTAIPLCTHPLVILADVRQDYHPDAIPALAAYFRDPEVGAVSGKLEIAASASGSGQGVDLYWKIERKLREWEGAFDSVIGCTGAIYALRRDLYKPLHEATILDDVVVPMRIVASGHRVCYAPEAVAYDPQTLQPQLEKKRKLRTLAGNYQMLEQHPGWLLPWRNRTWWQLISHKYLRLAVPWLLLALVILALCAPWSPLTAVLLVGQAAAYGLAILGIVRPGLKFRPVSIASGYVLLQWSCLKALGAYLQARRDALTLWQAGAASPAAAPVPARQSPPGAGRGDPAP